MKRVVLSSRYRGGKLRSTRDVDGSLTLHSFTTTKIREFYNLMTVRLESMVRHHFGFVGTPLWTHLFFTPGVGCRNPLVTKRSVTHLAKPLPRSCGQLYKVDCVVPRLFSTGTTRDGFNV